MMKLNIVIDTVAENNNPKTIIKEDVLETDNQDVLELEKEKEFDSFQALLKIFHGLI